MSTLTPTPKKRHRFLRVLGILALVVIGIAVVATLGQDTDPTVLPPRDGAPIVEDEPAPESATLTAGDEVGPWRVESIKAEADALGDYQVTLRLTNATDAEVNGDLFELTLLDPADDSVVGTLVGAANNVPAGDTTTVVLIGTVAWSEDAWVYDLESAAF